ncbi:MAG: ribonuclease P protein component [Candidatus Portnoybacteria bacterium]|nr:ribonuclease P protein component [Candidatus Portnoybacteria bacterium]
MLSRKYKLKKDNDFKKVFKQGKNYQQEFIKIKVLKNNLAYNRFGFIVGLKISKKSIERNKIKRRLEETVRLKLKQISASGGKSGFDVVVLVNQEIIEKNYQEIEKTLINLFRKANLIWSY